jgi:undecaprenyl pyrophosphate phosphatase UppP
MGGIGAVWKAGSELDKQRNIFLAFMLLGALPTVGTGVLVRLAIQNGVIALAVGTAVLVLAGLLLLGIAARHGQHTPTETNYIGLGIAIGAGLGVAYGAAMSAALGSPAFLGTGIAIGSGLNARREDDA